MSDIKVKADDLEEFAVQIGKAERECNDALDAINWHFSSLLANFPGVVPGSIHNLEADLKYSIKKYKSKLDDAQRIVKLTAANMKNDEQKMSGKVGGFLLELVGWYDIQRVFSEYDPVTGEKLSAGDRVLAVGFLALTFVPPAKAAGVGGKAVIKGVGSGLPSLAKSPEAFMKIRNVLDPKRVQQAFRSVYNEVVKGPIAATKVWFDKIKKGIGDIPIPQLRQEAIAGVGVVNKTARDAFGDAKDFIQRIKSSKVDEVDVKGVDGVEGVAKGTGKDIQIPSVRNNEFNKWFDNLSVDDFEKMWSNPHLKSKIEDRIRRPGGYHEWHLVARTPQFKKWGVSMDDIKEMRTLTKDVEFVNPPGRHGRRGSTKAHNEILKIIDSAPNYESFVRELNEWASKRMKNGVLDLPEGLRR